FGCSQPHVRTSRCGGSISTISPAMAQPRPLTSTRHPLPGLPSDSAAAPIQRAIFSGSVKYWKTTSGLASTRTSLTTTPCSPITAIGRPPLVELYLRLQPLKAAVPELLEKASNLREGLRSRSVEAPHSVSPLAHQPGLAEDPQVLRYRLPGDVELRGDLPGRELVVPHQPQDGSSARLRYGLEHGLHAASKVKPSLAKVSTCNRSAGMRPGQRNRSSAGGRRSAAAPGPSSPVTKRSRPRARTAGSA